MAMSSVSSNPISAYQAPVVQKVKSDSDGDKDASKTGEVEQKSSKPVMPYPTATMGNKLNVFA